MERRTALVTGATAGIGAAFARQLAASGYQLVLVARDRDRLHDQAAELTGAHGTPVEVLPADLTDPADTAAVERRLTESPVDLLVNNAGFSLGTGFLKSAAAEQERLLLLNVHAVMRLTRAALPGMVARAATSPAHPPGIVNVSSVAGFTAAHPGSTYPATKAWVNNFTESVAAAVADQGVRMLALCPGYVRTEFHQRAGVDISRTPDWLWLDADAVAARGLRDLARGKVVSIVDWRYRLVVGAMRVVPRSLVRAAARFGRGRPPD